MKSQEKYKLKLRFVGSRRKSYRKFQAMNYLNAQLKSIIWNGCFNRRNQQISSTDFYLCILINNLNSNQKMDKMVYLQSENQSLRNQILDLKETIAINKTQIDILSRQLQTNPQSKKLLDVIYGYRSKQEELQIILSSLKDEINQLKSDNLVLRQLNQQQNSQIKSLEERNAEIVTEFQKSIKALEEKIVFYEKNHKEYDKVSGFVLKNRQIFSPQDMVMELRNKEEQLNNEIRVMKAMVEQAKTSQDNLMIVNTVLRNKIVSLQAKLAVPNKQLGEVLDKSLKRLMLYFIEVQKKIVDGNVDSDSDEEEDIQLIAPQLSGLFAEKKLRIQKDYGVPHLDLLKIRDQMQQNNSKIKEALLARNHLSDKEKIERLEIQLQYTRRELSRKIIDIKDEKQKRKKMEALNAELEQRNLLLIEANIKLQKKVQGFWKKIQSNLQTNPMDQTIVQEPMKSNHNIGKEPRNKESLTVQSTIDFKIHLSLMAKELEKNEKLTKIEKLKQKEEQENEEQPKLKRSNSNPFLYFNERRKQILEVKNEEQQNDESKIRLEQTYFAPSKKMGFEQVLDEIDI